METDNTGRPISVSYYSFSMRLVSAVCRTCRAEFKTYARNKKDCDECRKKKQGAWRWTGKTG